MTLQRGLIAFVLIAAGCTLAVLPIFAISWGELPTFAGRGSREAYAADVGSAIGRLDDARTSAPVEFWLGTNTFVIAAFVLPVLTLMLPLQTGRIRFVAAGVDLLVAVFIVVAYLADDPSASRKEGLALAAILAAAAVMITLAVLHVVGRVRYAALVLGFLVLVAAVLQVVSLLELATLSLSFPGGSEPGDFGDGPTVSPAWVMFVGFLLAAGGCVLAAGRRGQPVRSNATG